MYIQSSELNGICIRTAFIYSFYKDIWSSFKFDETIKGHGYRVNILYHD